MVAVNRKDIAITAYVLNELAENKLVPREITEGIKKHLSAINQELWEKEKQKENKDEI